MVEHHTSPSNPSKTPADAAKNVAASAKVKAETVAEDVKTTAADAAEREAENVRRAADAYEGNPYAQQAAEQISDTLTHVAATVRDADFASIQEDVTDFARRNPVVFFGAAAALGFLAVRAMKASDRAETDLRAEYRHDYPSVPEGQRAYPDQNARHWGEV